MLRLRCTCGKSLKLPPAHVGKLASCPACRSKVRIVATRPPQGEARLKGLLRIQEGPHRVGEQVFLGGAEPIAVGKSDTAPFRLAATSVSRQHCQLLPSSRGWRIEDLGSTNGLYINGRRVKAHNLLDGDVVTIGEFHLRYTYEPAKRRPDETPESWQSADSTAIPDENEKNLHFLDDAALLSATSAATAMSGGTPPPPPPPPANDDPFTFEFAAEDADAGPPISLPVQPPVGPDGFRDCPECNTQLPPGAMLCVQCGYDLRSGKRLQTFGDTVVVPSRRAGPKGSGSIAAYLSNALRSFGFIVNPGSAATFLIVAFIAALQPIIAYAGCIGLGAAFVIKGWLASFYFNTVTEAAAGEDSLPDLSLTGGWIDDVIIPFFKFAATWLLVLAPAVIYLSVTATDFTAIDPTTLGINMVALLALGVFFWPMLMLAAALGGIGMAVRIDLLVKSVARSFLPYLLVCLLTGGTVALTIALYILLESSSLAIGGSPLAAAMIGEVVQLFFWIVAMRCIGLYYHHFKERFAWSWG